MGWGAGSEETPPPRLGCGQKGQREAKPTSMQTGPLGPRRNRITENAENCDVSFNCFLQGSLNPKKKWKTENSSPSLTWLWSEVLSAGSRQDRQLFWPLQRGGGCHCVHQGYLVCGRAGHRPLAGHPLVGSGLMCFERPLGAVGGTGHLCTEEGEEQLPGKVAPHSLSLPKAMHFLQACLQPPVSLPAHRRSVLILNLTLLLSF